MDKDLTDLINDSYQRIVNIGNTYSAQNINGGRALANYVETYVDDKETAAAVLFSVGDTFGRVVEGFSGSENLLSKEELTRAHLMNDFGMVFCAAAWYLIND